MYQRIRAKTPNRSSGTPIFKSARWLAIVFVVASFVLSATVPAIVPPPDIMFVSNFGNSTIEKFDSSGTDRGVFVTVVNPTGLAFDNSGNLYVVSDNPSGYAIEKFRPNGTESVFANTGLSCPQALAFDRDGNLYVANACNATIEKYTPDGAGTIFADSDDGLNNPIGLAFDSAGNMFISVANGAWDQNNSSFGTNWGESMLKIPTSGTLGVSFANTLNWFTPNNW
ncbi:MAG: hypothetical protein ACJ74Y_16225, partial [Bryobacteraceae bacterium]